MEKIISAVIQRSIFQHRIFTTPDNIALIDYDNDRSYTYKDLDLRAERLASCLQNVFKMKKGDRLGICAKNSLVYFDAFFACYKTGIILTTYNGGLPASELKQLML